MRVRDDAHPIVNEIARARERHGIEYSSLYGFLGITEGFHHVTDGRLAAFYVQPTTNHVSQCQQLSLGQKPPPWLGLGSECNCCLSGAESKPVHLGNTLYK